MEVFSCIRHGQNELEASTKPTIMKVIPMLEDIKFKLMRLGSCMINPDTMEPPSLSSQLLVRRTMELPIQIEYHDL